MAVFQWRSFLERFSSDLLANEHIRTTLLPDVVTSGWLGFDPATESEITALERRLGVSLPPSYRQFLGVTNGWRCTGPFVYRLWSTAEVTWLSERHQQDIIDPWLKDADAYDIPDDECISVTATTKTA